MKQINRVVTLTAFALIALSITSLAHAAPSLVFYVRTDKSSYVPGEGGSLVITLRNEGDQAMTIRNLTINWPWMMYLNDHWDGNVSINGITTALAAGQAYNTAQSFSIPTDGRAYRFNVGTLKVGTDLGGTGGSYRTSNFYITMNAPTYTPLEVGTQLFSIILIGIMAVATVLLFLVNTALRKPRTSATH